MNTDTQPAESPGFNTGVFAYSEAARFLGVTPRKVGSWARGYTYAKKTGGKASVGPILQTAPRERRVLTFHELIELFIVREYVNAGATIPNVRRASANLSQSLGTFFPFASARLLVANRKLLVKEGEHFRDVVNGQTVANFAEEFAMRIDWDEQDLAQVWHPLGRQIPVVVDPRRCFGAPTIVDTRLRVDVLAANYQAEGGGSDRDDWDVASFVAESYGTTADRVLAAVRGARELCLF